MASAMQRQREFACTSPLMVSQRDAEHFISFHFRCHVSWLSLFLFRSPTKQTKTKLLVLSLRPHFNFQCVQGRDQGPNFETSISSVRTPSSQQRPLVSILECSLLTYCILGLPLRCRTAYYDKGRFGIRGLVSPQIIGFGSIVEDSTNRCAGAPQRLRVKISSDTCFLRHETRFMFTERDISIGVRVRKGIQVEGDFSRGNGFQWRFFAPCLNFSRCEQQLQLILGQVYFVGELGAGIYLSLLLAGAMFFNLLPRGRRSLCITLTEFHGEHPNSIKFRGYSVSQET